MFCSVCQKDFSVGIPSCIIINGEKYVLCSDECEKRFRIQQELNNVTTNWIRPPTPGEMAIFVEYRTRPSILIFPEHEGRKGYIVTDERFDSLLKKLTVLEWAKLSYLAGENDPPS